MELPRTLYYSTGMKICCRPAITQRLPHVPIGNCIILIVKHLLGIIIVKTSVNLDSAPDFRFIAEESGIRTNPLRRYCLPEDIAHLTSGEDPYKLMDLLKLRSGQADTTDSDWNFCGYVCVYVAVLSWRIPQLNCGFCKGHTIEFFVKNISITCK